MDCSGAIERINRLGTWADIERQPDLAAHVERCLACREVLRRHQALLAALPGDVPLPEFGDLAPPVLSRLDDSRSRRWSGWRLAAAAALAVAALTLGYRFGQMSAGASPSADSMAAIYQAAFTGQSTGSTELAYLEASGQSESPIPVRSAP